jgi:hypothetical protein
MVVAQISNLPYRRFPIGKPSAVPQLFSAAVTAVKKRPLSPQEKSKNPCKCSFVTDVTDVTAKIPPRGEEARLPARRAEMPPRLGEMLTCVNLANSQATSANREKPVEWWNSQFRHSWPSPSLR